MSASRKKFTHPTLNEQRHEASDWGVDERVSFSSYVRLDGLGPKVRTFRYQSGDELSQFGV
jgi:hypothetical protein